MKAILSTLVLAAIVSGFSSCEKKKSRMQTEPAPVSDWGPSCAIRSIVSRHNGCIDSLFIPSFFEPIQGYQKFRNCNSGAPGAMTVSGKQFIYERNKVYIVDTAAGADRDTLIIDPISKRILEKRRSSPQIREAMVTRFEYTAKGVLQRSITYYDGIAADTTLYSFSAGNLVSQVNILSG